jgi:hypothetical protein
MSLGKPLRSSMRDLAPQRFKAAAVAAQRSGMPAGACGPSRSFRASAKQIFAVSRPSPDPSLLRHRLLQHIWAILPPKAQRG